MERRGLRVNTPQVIHETIDGEVIVIKLTSGTYYSLRGGGADVWHVLQSAPGADASAIAAELARRFGRPSDTLGGEIADFLEALKREELVVEAEGSVPASIPSSAGLPSGNIERAFEAPVLEKFTDMQDLVLIDPVHEVGATGWPHPKPDVSQTTA
ncbi:MAG TPA: PqqD family protein [Gaiellaceae bacterium]|nr:PqqD family protein [Gaiellaceae bacterium]